MFAKVQSVYIGFAMLHQHQCAGQSLPAQMRLFFKLLFLLIKREKISIDIAAYPSLTGGIAGC
jgi:hypothetical protein